MKDDIAQINCIQEFTDSELETFTSAVRIFLSKTFIIRGIQKEEYLYNFVINNIAVFSAYFACMGAHLVRDDSLGVIAFRGGADTRLRLTRDETCALLVFRLLYEERRTELSLSAFPTSTIQDFKTKFDTMTGEKIKKTNLTDILHRFQIVKLIEIGSQDYTDEDSLIVLLPSIAISVDHDSIDEMLSTLTSVEGDSVDNT